MKPERRYYVGEISPPEDSGGAVTTTFDGLYKGIDVLL